MMEAEPKITKFVALKLAKQFKNHIDGLSSQQTEIIITSMGGSLIIRLGLKDGTALNHN